MTKHTINKRVRGGWEPTRYTITLNHSAKTYTIRRYDSGKLTAKYRSYPQGSDFTEYWTESDIRNFLRYSNDYYIIK